MAQVVLVEVLVLGLVCLARAKTDAPAKPVVPRLPPTCDQILPGKCAPYIVVGGVMKCGTNGIAAYLSRHKQVFGQPFASFCGEIHFFSDFGKSFGYDPTNTSSPEQRALYAQNFPDTDWKTSFAMDKSHSYVSDRRAGERMHALMPRARVTVVLCDPMRRAWSHFNHERKVGIRRAKDKFLGSHCPFLGLEDAENLALALERVNRTLDTTACSGLECPDVEDYECRCLRLFCHIFRFSYVPTVTSNIERMVQLYGSDNILLIDGNELNSDPHTVVSRLVNFYGLPHAGYPRPFKELHANVGSKVNKVYQPAAEVPEWFWQRLAPYQNMDKYNALLQWGEATGLFHHHFDHPRLPLDGDSGGEDGM